MITSHLHPLVPPSCRETAWLIPGLLPVGEVVMLEGGPGLGKTLLATAWAARLSRDGAGQGTAALILTASIRAAELGLGQLARHEPDFSRLHAIDWTATARDENGRREAVVEEMIFHIEQHLEQNHPRLLIIDSLDEAFSVLATEPAHRQRHFWSQMVAAARRHGCTILLLTRQCSKRDRAGRVASLAADFARCVFSLGWHPADASLRVLTRTRDLFSPAGVQWHVAIDEAGQADCHPTNDHDHVPPGQGGTPVTWLSRRQKRSNLPLVMKAVEEYLDGKKPIRMVRDHVLGLGHSYPAFREAMRHLDVEAKKEGSLWWYIPGPEIALKHTLRAPAPFPDLPTPTIELPSGRNSHVQRSPGQGGSPAPEPPRHPGLGDVYWSLNQKMNAHAQALASTADPQEALLRFDLESFLATLTPDERRVWDEFRAEENNDERMDEWDVRATHQTDGSTRPRRPSLIDT